MDALLTMNTRTTPQSQPARGDQSQNNAGGYTFTLDDNARLRRFLTLGVDGGTYYASAPELVKDNAGVVARMAATDPETLVSTIVDVSTRGAAPRQNPALFALAYAAAIPESAPAALAALPLVARTGTHLLLFAAYVEQFRGWGRGLRRAVANWYLDRDPDAVAYQAVKYRQRNGWSHRDLLRLAHPKPADAATRATFDWIARNSVTDQTPALIHAFTEAQAATDRATWVRLIRDSDLSWEMLPDTALAAPEVWAALLDSGLPQTALLRQLPRLTRLGLLPDTGGHTTEVVEQLTDPDRLRHARVHPVNVLTAQRTYAAGKSWRGTSEWTPSRRVVDALDAAFYQAYGNITPAGRRTLLALDVSGSMAMGSIGGSPLTPREASAALALVQLATEPQATTVGFTAGHPRPPRMGLRRYKASADGRLGGFINRNPYRAGSSGEHLTPLDISPRQRLDDAIRTVSNLPFGGTDCALPMSYAMDRELEFDTFVIYTDNETWAGQIHPFHALREYRERSGIAAKLVVVGMTATQFTIADPADGGMLDVAGFDAAVPNLISEFSRGL